MHAGREDVEDSRVEATVRLEQSQRQEEELFREWIIGEVGGIRRHQRSDDLADEVGNQLKGGIRGREAMLVIPGSIIWTNSRMDEAESSVSIEMKGGACRARTIRVITLQKI
jgi:hypothetical protein